MAQKRYFTNDTAAISLPSPTGSWDVNTATGTNALGAAGAGAGAASQASETSTTNPTTSLARRFVDSTQMVSGGDFGGDFTAVIAANESNAAADAFHRIVIKVVSADGTTTRGSQAFVHGSELTTTNTAYTFTGTISPAISCSVNDRIVVEVGGHFTNTVNTNYQVNIRRGGTAGDLVAGDTGANANDRSGHITFSDATADARFSSGATGDIAASIPVQQAAIAATAADVRLIATYVDTATAGGEVEVAVPDVAGGDALLVVVANAYTDPADAEPTSTLAGAWEDAGSGWIGDPEDPTYQNQNLGTWLFTASAAGTATVELTESNETVLAVLHLRPLPGLRVCVGDIDEVLDDQGGGGPDAAQPLGPVDGVTGGMLVGAWAGIRFAAYTWSVPSGMDQAAQAQDGASTQALLVATQAITATASTGTRTSTATLAPSNGFAGKLIALTLEVAGDLTGSIPVQQAAIAGEVVQSGELAGTVPLQVASVSADVIDSTITGEVAGAVPLQTAAVAGEVEASGVFAGSVPLQVGSVQADIASAGEVAGSLPMQQVALLGEVPATGALAGAIPIQVIALAEGSALDLDLPLRFGTPSLAGGIATGAPTLDPGQGAGTSTLAAGLGAGAPA